ncbi:dhbF [Symbiodinium natans]|uniref:DhbF protein n=1 Tax=Symbiodinium natans TaxID=878477 RepID=A0A812N610_9DINO|nr:dhbF [Symbiodinium natans]
MLTVELFEALATAQPQREAVASDDDLESAWNLETLRHRARSLAGAIQCRLASRYDALVAVCLPRGPALPMALLGVWYAGAAYVPLEPSFPVARLRFLLEDSQAQLLLTEPRTEPKDLRHDGQTLRLHWPSGEVESVDSKSPASQLSPEAPSTLAYVIYTSGSTGKPKGVRVAAGAVANVLQAFERSVRQEWILTVVVCKNIFPFNYAAGREDDVLVAVTTFCFDISVLEKPGGGGLRLGELPEGFVLRPARLIFQATPTSFRSLMQAGWEGGDNVAAICGGEAFPSQLAAPLFHLCRAGLWNAYGPTETTIWSAAHHLQGNETVVPIGIPLLGTKLQLLSTGDSGDSSHDSGLELEACEGELLIAGVGVAEGYLRRPDLNAAKFVAFNEGRAFLTGDRVRQSAGGYLEFMGRMDHQVKIRGFRVELGEVESKLGAHAQVAAAVVLLAGGSDSPELWAFVTTTSAVAGGESALRSSLRRSCAEELPSHAIPSRLGILEDMPLLPSGKVDRQKLLAGSPPPALADASGKSNSVVTEAPGSLRQMVAELVERATGVAVEEETAELTALGIDSVSVLPRMREVQRLRSFLRLRNSARESAPVQMPPATEGAERTPEAIVVGSSVIVSVIKSRAKKR